MQFVKNPFYIYILVFSMVFATYGLGWSGLYPPLSLSVITFLLGSFAIALLFGYVFESLGKFQYKKVPLDHNLAWITSFIWLGYILEFVLNGGIPIVQVLMGADFFYKDFGIKSFHVFLATFNSFFAVYCFHHWLNHKNRYHLLIFVLNLLPALLVYNRGMLLMNLTACLFVFLFSLKRLKFRQVAFISIAALAIFWVFGIAGNLRQTQGREYSSEYIMELSKADSKFMESSIPKPYIWAYLYISSPLANFQVNVDKTLFDRKEHGGLIAYEMLPDFISKRVGPALGLKERKHFQITNWLTVGSIYASTYSYNQWAGPIGMLAFLLLFNAAYLIWIKPENVFFVTALAILNTIMVYNTFSNMYAFSGLSLQLAYPLMLSFYGKYKLVNSAV